MEISRKEIQLAYSLLSDVATSTNNERKFEIQGIIKGMLIKKYPRKKNEIQKNIDIIFSRGQIIIAHKNGA